MINNINIVIIWRILLHLVSRFISPGSYDNFLTTFYLRFISSRQTRELRQCKRDSFNFTPFYFTVSLLADSKQAQRLPPGKEAEHPRRELDDGNFALKEVRNIYSRCAKSASFNDVVDNWFFFLDYPGEHGNCSTLWETYALIFHSGRGNLNYRLFERNFSFGRQTFKLDRNNGKTYLMNG